MNSSGAISIVKKVFTEDDLLEFLSENAGYFRVFRYCTSKVNSSTGTLKFSLSKNTITYLKKSNLIADIVSGQSEEIELIEVDSYVRYFLIEKL